MISEQGHPTWRSYLDAKSIPEPNSGCHLWLGAVSKRTGYGIYASWRGLNMMPHRASWTERNGPIPVGLHVLHKCDVRSCINPEHLFLGTNSDNVADRDSKGRQPKGERIKQAKLRSDQVLGIRKDCRPHDQVAQAYGVDVSQISRIKSGKAWKHVT